MTVKELIEKLQNFSDDIQVSVWNSREEQVIATKISLTQLKEIPFKVFGLDDIDQDTWILEID